MHELAWVLLKIPYITRVLNSAIPLFCIKSQEYKMAITNFFVMISYSSKFLKNESEILKSVRFASRIFMWK